MFSLLFSIKNSMHVFSDFGHILRTILILLHAYNMN